VIWEKLAADRLDSIEKPQKENEQPQGKPCGINKI
jgi:hypothetical protein